MNIPTEFTTSYPSYSRNVGTYQWGTVCLPYPVSSGSDIQYYTLSSSTIGTTNQLLFSTVDEVPANTPAIFMANTIQSGVVPIVNYGSVTVPATPSEISNDQELSGWKLVGTYKTETFTENVDNLDDKYYIAGDNFWKFTQRQKTNGVRVVTLKPFRAYFQTTDAAAPVRFGISILGESGTPTAVGEMDEDGNLHMQTGTFTITGQRLDDNSNVRGLVIKNGKVVFNR